MRLFWKASGGDRYLLERSTYSDQLKYMCLGGIIVATGLMAGLAGGYAFYTIFSPKGEGLEDVVDMPTVWQSAAFGLFWGMMIFNLDRFIVSSTGKGDGTEKITWSEFTGSIPRLILGAIIAVTIATPIELRMFKSEIDVELDQRQMAEETLRRDQIDEEYAERIQEQRSAIVAMNARISEKQARANSIENQLLEEIRIIRPGPKARALEQQWNITKGELADLKVELNPMIDSAEAKIASLEAEKQVEYDKVKAVANGLDGLLERISISHEIAPWYISVFVTLLFLAIELTPIFFKMMLVKSPYDFMKDNVEELIKAEQGILVTYDYHKDKKGQERDLIKYLDKEKVVVEQASLQQVQKELTERAIAMYKQKMLKKIEENPEHFIYSESNHNGNGREI